jgi:membrane associated rhomboid family serine protease
VGEAAKKLETAELWLVDVNTGKVVSLTNGFAVGRTTGDLLLADDGSVSSKHCVFHVSGNAVEIEDLGSRNGTFVGDQRIEPKKRLGLLPGTQIKIGSYAFEIKASSQVPKERATAMELASLSSQIAPDNIPTKAPGAWAAKAQRDLLGNIRSQPGELVSLSSELTPSRPLRAPSARGTGTISGIRPQVGAPVHRAVSEPHNPGMAYVFLVANLAAYAWAVQKGADAFDPSVKSLIAIGGNINGLTTNGQWWRLVTAMFAHSGVFHLASNMAVLAFLGVPVARLLGTTRFALVYMVAGLLGGIASAAFNPPNVVTVGASGAIFGLVGALLAAQLMGKGASRAIGKFGLASTATFIVRNIGIGVQGIDVAAHAGGLLAGFLLAYVLSSGNGDRDPKRPAIGAVVSLALILALTMFVPHKQLPREPSQFAEHMTEISALVGTLEREYREGLAETKAGKTTQEAFLKFMRSRIIPGVELAAQHVQSVVAEGEREKTAKDAQLVSVNLWKEQLTELVALLETKDEAHYKTLEALQQKAVAASADLDRAIVNLRKPAGAP